MVETKAIKRKDWCWAAELPTITKDGSNKHEWEAMSLLLSLYSDKDNFIFRLNDFSDY